ncbi:hypothetical protein [Pseudoalteromonas luteoviolacea]|uniref:Uncharacterized protein n=1 Tax=Pseudoalteromonas luteoviolacea DSM 6061 TaxID=1365250 RepID=A0A166ZZA8_9GAMM|nr:hypothetical protein [Pseudoalteromonas luteoviolacea]KZN44825.1 hypothetical protein N475_25875 [Pseudoalteromonas luteoviolacea DSM 6061]
MIRENYFNSRASVHCVAVAFIYLALDIKFLLYGESKDLNFEFLFNVKVFVCFLYLLCSNKAAGYFEHEGSPSLDFTLHMTAFLFMLWLMVIPGVIGVALSKYFGVVLIVLMVGSLPILFEVIKCHEFQGFRISLKCVELFITVSYLVSVVAILMYLINGDWSWGVRPIHTLIRISF